MSNDNQARVKDFLHLGILLLMGLGIFFFAAIFILSARLKSDTRVAVPALVGKSYLDEHNRLEHQGFKVDLVNEHSLRYPYGFILAQNLPAGSVVNMGTKLTLTVNQSQTILKTPNLTGIKITLAEEALKNIHYGPHTFSLRMGVVTAIASDKPEGEILAQFPSADTPVSPETPIHLLVAGTDLKISSVTPIEILKRITYLQNMALEIKSQETEKAEQWNRVMRTQAQDGRLVATVGKSSAKETADEKYFIYRVHWLNPIDLGLARGVYTVARICPETKETLAADKNKTDNLPAREKISFQDITYLYITSDDIPLFEDLHGHYAFWSGKHTQQEITSLPYKTIRIKSS